MSGPDLCRILRGDPRFSHACILMLTARVTEMDVVAGLNAGADDDVVQPMLIRELMARAKARIRRGSQVAELKSLKRFRQVWLDTASYRAGAGDRAFDSRCRTPAQIGGFAKKRILSRAHREVMRFPRQSSCGVMEGLE